MSKIGLNTSLLMIDIQNDFCPGGALAVKEGDQIVPIVNNLQKIFPVNIMTQDWHPETHQSFVSNHKDKEPLTTVEMFYGTQVLWPNHCVQDTSGSFFHSSLITKHSDLIIRKGFRPEIDSYSAFFENDQSTPTGLDGYLKTREIKKLYLCGLALDFCVFFSAIDGAKLGFDVFVILDACRAIDLDGSLEIAMEKMEKIGIKFISSSELLA